jgi:hypothetical protein
MSENGNKPVLYLHTKNNSMGIFYKLTNWMTKNSNPVLIRSKTEDKILKQANQEMADHLKKSIEESDSISTYEHKEKGAFEIVEKWFARLSQFFDSLHLHATNRKDDYQEKYEESAKLETKQELYDQRKVDYAIEEESINKRKSIQMPRFIEKLKGLKESRAYFKKTLENLADYLDKKVDVRTALGFIVQRTLIIFGIIIMSTSEVGNALNSLMVLKANPMLELCTTAGIALLLFVASKALIYLFSNGSLFIKSNEKDGLINAYDLGGFLVFAVSLGFVLLLADLRIAYMEEMKQHPNEAVQFFLRFLCVGLFMSTVLLTMLLTNSHGKAKWVYVKTLFKYRKTCRRVERLQAKMSRKRTGYADEHTRAKENLRYDRNYIFNEREQESKTQLLEDTALQNAILAMSRQSRKELIHGLQAQMHTARGVMEQKTGTQHEWKPIDFTSLINEPEYQVLAKNKTPMKNHFTMPRIAGILVAIFFLVTSCGSLEQHPIETEIITIVDETSWNPLQSEITADQILRLAHIDDSDSPNAVSFTAHTLNDVALNRTYSASLKPSDEVLVNAFTRQEEIDAFSEEISGIFDQVYIIQPETFETTQLWIPIAKILESHQESPAHKVVIIQSDFLENSTNLSFYDIKKSLEKDPERIKEYLDDLYPIDELYDYEIVFLYQADRENDRLFTAATNVFAGLLRDKGATVSIKASL